MNQIKIMYSIKDDLYKCNVYFGSPGKALIFVGELTFTKEQWASVPKAFAHNTVIQPN